MLSFPLYIRNSFLLFLFYFIVVAVKGFLSFRKDVELKCFAIILRLLRLWGLFEKIAGVSTVRRAQGFRDQYWNIIV